MSVDTAAVTIRQLGGVLAAEAAVDLTQLDDETFEQVHAAFLEHCVLVFRDQALDPDSHVAFARRFGEVHAYPKLDDAERRELVLIANMPSGRHADGGTRKVTEVWHADSTWLERPPAHAILAARELPAFGGDTLFANQYAAYESLSDAMKEMLGGLRAIHQPPGYMEGESVSRPVVVTHPETGRKLLYVNVNAVCRFDGMTEEESRGLLGFLFSHAVSPEFVYRHRWLPGDVVMWDNRCTQHYAVDDYGDAPRVLARASLVGHVPS
jgi:taurine dioxygenase